MLTLLWVYLHFLSVVFHTLKCHGGIPHVTLLTNKVGHLY